METRLGTTIRWGGLKHILFGVVKENQVVLDVGAYDGFILRKLLERKDFTAVLIDLDIEGLRKAKERGVFSVRASGTDMPLKKSAVDVVLGLDVVEHVREDGRLVMQMGGVLKDGGVIVLSTPRKDAKLTHDSDMRRLNDMWGHVRSGYATEEIKKLLERADLRITRHTHYHNIITRYFYYYFSWRNVLNLSMENRAKIMEKAALLQRWLPVGMIEHVFVARKEGASVPGISPQR